MVVPHIDLKTMIKVVHLTGLALGLGGAVLLDVLALRFLVLERISIEVSRIFAYGTRIVLFGLVLLWISGLAYLGYYYVYDMHSLSNPKIWAKLTIVVILTLNGWWIHHWILPLIQKNIGNHFFSRLSLKQRRILLSSSVISVCSWFMPLLLGACKELNFCIHASTILILYGGLVTIGLVTAWAMARHLQFIRQA
jgi:hypothetical protein